MTMGKIGDLYLLSENESIQNILNDIKKDESEDKLEENYFSNSHPNVNDNLNDYKQKIINQKILEKKEINNQNEMNNNQNFIRVFTNIESNANEQSNIIGIYLINRKEII